MVNVRLIKVEVAYARPDEQIIIPVEVPEGTTLEQGIVLSRICDHFPEIDVANAKVGVFSKISAPSTILKSGDRIEIYRPLIADPKAARRKRAKRDKPKTHATPARDN